MRLIAKFFLWLTTVAIPVFIAACYGAPYSYSKTGRVIDSETDEGINGIEVQCIENGTMTNSAYTYEDGTFYLYYDYPCDDLRIEDVDGEDNGGLYLPRTIPFCEECEDIVIELHK